MSRVTIERDGLTLVGDREEPFGEIYDMAILMHGFTANRNTELLRQIADDLRDEIADGKAILEYVRTDPHVRNIFLVGHSQGGVIASMLAGLYPDVIKKVILLAPAAQLKDDALKGNTQGAVYDPNHIPDTVPLVGNKLGMKLGGFYLRTAQVLPIYEVSARFSGPVSVIYGTNDQVVNPKYAKKYHDIYENSELHAITDADHRFTGQYKKSASDLTAQFLKPLF